MDSNETDLIIGRNAVLEALKAGRPADHLLVAKGSDKGPTVPIIAKCRERNIPVKFADVKKLDFASAHGAHQGVILYAAAHRFATVDDMFALARERGEKPFIIVCDGLEDPHNLGAIIRSAEAAGAHGVIIPERRSVSLTGTVGKASAGALEYVPVARVVNLSKTVDELKERGLWVWAADMDGSDYAKTDVSGAVALVVGGEGKGVSRLVGEHCDGKLSIPMNGRINSLNASVAAGILMFRVAEVRKTVNGA